MDNIDFVKSLYAAYANGKIDTLLQAMDPKIKWYSNADPALLPWGGERRGPTEARRFFEELAANVETEQFQPREFMGGVDFVVVLGQSKGRMKATGRRVDDQWVHLFRIRNGKVAEFRSFGDTHALVQAFFGGDIHAAGLPGDRPAARPH
jgi:uncharacterized protein